MKKRRIKKKIFTFVITVILTVILVIFLKNQSNNVNKKSNKTDNNPVVETTDGNRKMSLLAVGDVLIHESVYKDALTNNGYDFSKMFEYIKPITKKYDLNFCNQESIIGGSTLGISGYPSFNSPDEIGDEMVDLGFNLISLANNHTLDKGEDAVLYSNSYWKSKNVITAGSYSSIEERDKVNIYEENGIKYAFLAYTTTSNGKTNKSYLLNMYSADKAKKDIEAVKDQVDVIVVSMHWGIEFSNEISTQQQEIASYLSSLGVNLIIGTHPHVVQPVNYVGDTLVIYSLGNVISNQLSLGLNQGIGLMVGMDINVSEAGVVTFDNLYKELILAYAENSTNFKVIPFSKLNNDLLSDYKNVEQKYMNIVNEGA